MTTVLQYLVVAAVVALILFGIALLLFGRGEQLSALPARTSPAVLPEEDISGQHVREVRFALALRGYRMADVDWTLERLAEELDRLRSLVAARGSTTPSTAEVRHSNTVDITTADPDAGQSDTPLSSGAPAAGAQSVAAPSVGVGSRPSGLFEDEPTASESPR